MTSNKSPAIAPSAAEPTAHAVARRPRNKRCAPAARNASANLLAPALRLDPTRLPRGDQIAAAQAISSMTELIMKRMLLMLTKVFRRCPVSLEEQYLAQSVDAHEFEVRLQALERGRA